MPLLSKRRWGLEFCGAKLCNLGSTWMYSPVLPAKRLELLHARAQKILSLSCLPFHQAGVCVERVTWTRALRQECAVN